LWLEEMVGTQRGERRDGESEVSPPTALGMFHAVMAELKDISEFCSILYLIRFYAVARTFHANEARTLLCVRDNCVKSLEKVE
jgi:hypothetical protein